MDQLHSTLPGPTRGPEKDKNCTAVLYWMHSFILYTIHISLFKNAVKTKNSYVLITDKYWILAASASEAKALGAL